MVVLALIYKNKTLDLIFSYQEWIKVHFFLTLLIFYSIFSISGILILPSAVFEILNGFIYATLFDGKIFGFFIGISIFLIFNSVSGTFAFAFSKKFFGKRLKEILVDSNEKMKMLNFIFKSQGFKALGLLKLSPLLPMSIFNYCLAAFESKL
jgi:uncharacterized membrane protein YdjX (TVP38/TMEM64 family)